MTPQPCHSHVCCGLLQIWPMLDVWAENGAYGLCRIGWRYNEENLYFSWSYMIVAMIWNTYDLSPSHLSRATAMFVVDCCQFGPSSISGLKMELMDFADLVGSTTEQICFPLALYDSINEMKLFRNVCITPQPCISHFCCWLLQIWPYLDFWAENGAYGLCRLGWRYNGENMYFSWSYMIVAMIWYTYDLSPSHLSHATSMFVVDCCQFGPS